MAMNLNTVKSYVDKGFNIIISGEAGTGKTHVLREAIGALGLSLKYYNAATLDPFTDLIGIPVPNNETETVKYFRPREIDQVDVIFFDELNRADPRTLNAVFELIQFKSINGEPLPKLKCVVAAINPATDDYTVDDLDMALLDRFDIYLQAEPKIDFGYFKNKFGAEVARAASSWWGDYHAGYSQSVKDTNNKSVYISPRRMDKIVGAYLTIPNRSTIRDSLPVGAVADVSGLERELKKAIALQNQPPEARKKSNTSSNDIQLTVEEILNMNATELRKNGDRVEEILSSSQVDAQTKNLIISAVASALNSGIGVNNIVDRFRYAVNVMSPAQKRLMQNGWSLQKRNDLAIKLNSF